MRRQTGAAPPRAVAVGSRLVDVGGGSRCIFTPEREEEAARLARGSPGKLDDELAFPTSISPVNPRRSSCVQTSHDEITMKEYFNDF